MHHSRPSTLMIDCLETHFEDSVRFWSQALGLPVKRRPAAGQRYFTLGMIDGPLFVRLQRVGMNPGFHIDIETDSVGGERDRLATLGAHPRARVKRWWVMEDPSGNPFCLVRPESGLSLDRAGRRWSGE